MSDDLVLAGDIGGTKSNLALFRGCPQAPERVAGHRYWNREFSSLDEVVRRFYADSGLSAATACFGVAGAVLAGEAVLPNLGWRLSEQALARDLDVRTVHLINDLAATAHGISTLAPEQLHILNQGRSRAGGNRALIAAGTGLGMALLLPAADGWHVSASEGGHADFAPRDAEQMELLRFLTGQHDHVSVERLVSGQGLVNIYRFLRDQTGLEEPEWLAERLRGGADQAAAIADAGLAGKVPLAVKSLDLFLSVYGAATGNLALTALATDGIYIGGGIAPKLIDRLSHGDFMAAFVAKGRFAGLLADIPVRVILEPTTALLGAASTALLRLADDRAGMCEASKVNR